MATLEVYNNPVPHLHNLNDPSLEFAYDSEEDHDAGISPNLSTYTSVRQSLDIQPQAPTGAPVTQERTAHDSEKEEGAGLADPNVIFWDGPEDPENPMNWSNSFKWGNLVVILYMVFVTRLASTMLAPGVPEVMAKLHETSSLLAPFVVSVFFLGEAFGLLVLLPLSQIYGRRWIYIISNILFIIFTIACGVSSNFHMLIGFRFLQGSAGSASVTLAHGTITDLMPLKKRVSVQVIFGLLYGAGLFLGPVTGGFLIQAKGWQWVFYLTASSTGFIPILGFFLLSETFAPVLLERRAAKLRVDTGNLDLHSPSTILPNEVFRLSIVRPIRLLLTSPIVLFMSLYVALASGIFCLLLSTMTFVLKERYHFSTGIVGLTYIGVGVGRIVGQFFIGVFSAYLPNKAEGKLLKLEHYISITLTVLGGFWMPIGLFMYGWGTEKVIHWIVPLIGTAFVAAGLWHNYKTAVKYIIRAVKIEDNTSATTAIIVLRPVIDAILPLAGLVIYDKLGLGWGNSLLGFIALALILIPVIFKVYGERTNSKY
ncbi:MFS general substrate transporter [Lophium mytilinum]|uniref:MFS general substrate transporter n=1 Tax=Lophium mytilinum TaxID=390894 RepID=A0A6A6RD98_9PEZI|nr:MFS general substrate transporter [Lophium mytilinum]